MNIDVEEAAPTPTHENIFWGVMIATWIAVPILVAIDQWTKNLVVHYYYLSEVDPIIGEIFRLTRVHNTGAAFGVLQSYPNLFRNLTACAILAITVHKAMTSSRSLLYHTALGLVLAGAIGNFIDRIRYGYVVDFIQVGWNGWYWPSFNVADSAISVGVVLLLWGSLSPAHATMNSSANDSSNDAARDDGSDTTRDRTREIDPINSGASDEPLPRESSVTRTTVAATRPEVR